MRFFDINEYEKSIEDINIIIGGRGIGKTYSLLRYLVENGNKFVYMRTTKTELDECCGEFGNPFKAINRDFGYDITIKPNKTHGLVYSDGVLIGYAAALSTFENLRGVDLSDTKYMVYDEFISINKPRFDQFKAFINAYETINRNRELTGSDPLRCFLLSNSQSLNNDILAGFNLIGDVERMLKFDQEKFKRGNIRVILPVADISKEKAQTSFYKAIEQSNVYRENINNEFANDSFYGVQRASNINAYIPICCIDGIYIYVHKSDQHYYVCRTPATNIPIFTSKDNYIVFMRNYGRALINVWGTDHIKYSDFTTKTAMTNILRF